MKTNTTVVTVEKCERLAELVSEARANYPEIVERLSEPGFRGSVEEADLIFAYIDSVSPDDAADFVEWQAARISAGLRTSPGGTVIMARRHVVIHPCGQVDLM